MVSGHLRSVALTFNLPRTTGEPLLVPQPWPESHAEWWREFTDLELLHMFAMRVKDSKEGTRECCKPNRVVRFGVEILCCQTWLG